MRLNLFIFPEDVAASSLHCHFLAPSELSAEDPKPQKPKHPKPITPARQFQPLNPKPSCQDSLKGHAAEIVDPFTLSLP